MSGVETTTGPLGQGVATSVGMAIAQKWLASRYNRPGFELFDYNIYAVCGDGCMMEGIASEAASLAGHLGLDNLCWIYDNNHITIEGNTRIAFTEDVATRFAGVRLERARGRRCERSRRIEQASGSLSHDEGRPTFIVLDSHIGYGSPHRQDTAAAHGEPLGEERSGWPSALRLAGGRKVSRSRRESTNTSEQASASEAPKRRRSGWSCSKRTATEYPELAAEIEYDAAA